MKSKLVVLTLIAAGTMAWAVATPASAQNVSIRVDTPEFGIRIGHPGFRPPPVYVAPPPVFIPPPPVVYYPAPRVIYTPPPRVIYAPPPPVVYYPYPYYGRPHKPHPRYDRDNDGYRDGRQIEEVRVRY